MGVHALLADDRPPCRSLGHLPEPTINMTSIVWPSRDVLRMAVVFGAIAAIVVAKSLERERRAVDGGDHIAGLNSRNSGGAPRFRLVKNCAVGLRHAETVGEGPRHRTDPDTDPSADSIALSGMLDHWRVRSGLSGRDETAQQHHRADRNAHASLPRLARTCPFVPRGRDGRIVRPKPDTHFLRFLRGAPSETPSLEAC